MTVGTKQQVGEIGAVVMVNDSHLRLRGWDSTPGNHCGFAIVIIALCLMFFDQ